MDGTFLSGHGHPAMLLKTPNDEECHFCGLALAVYFCKDCRLRMCKNCFKLRREVVHWLHPEHCLRMSGPYFSMGICDGCNQFLGECKCYKCEQCEFYLCIDCCTSTTSRRPLRWENEKVLHYSHLHELTRCRFRDEFPSNCEICELRMRGIGYACIKCDHIVHESCLDSSRVIQHPFHPLHPLKRPDYMVTFDSSKIFCKACRGSQSFSGFWCHDCGVYLHGRCAEFLLRVIDFSCHIHSLLCLPVVPLFTFTTKGCPVCRKPSPTNEDPFFRCAECDLTFHVDCVSIPKSFKHRHHQHIVTLVDSSTDYESEEHYCDICEARRDPDTPVYQCERCNFFGHVECVLSKEEDFPRFLSSLEAKQLYKAESSERPDNSSNKQLQLVCHVHPLSLDLVTGRLCHMCYLEISGQAYKCEQCEDEFWVHEKCGELPTEFEHPLHPNHMLSLLKSPQLNFCEGYFICCLCSEITQGFNFACQTCDFMIDVKCAFPIQSKQLLNDKKYQKPLRHVVDDHELILVNTRRGTELEPLCNICLESCSDLTYCCMECALFAHKACLEWPAVIEAHPLHPQHRLQLASSRRHSGFCYACGDGVGYLWYQCEKYKLPKPMCRVMFHLKCGSSSACLLKQEHHDHRLYYIHKQPRTSLSLRGRQVCSLCLDEAKISYYICLKCKCLFHLGCLQLPQIAKHKWHLHWLALKDAVDYGGYYCDIIEEPRDFQHPVYCCEECNFVVHVECIISKEYASSVMIKEIENSGEDIPECSRVSSSSEIESDTEDMFESLSVSPSSTATSLASTSD